MLFNKTPLKGAYTIDLEKRGDERGFFSRLFCENEFKVNSLETKYVQINNSLSEKKGTLRGMHYQVAPLGEVKLIRCIKGALYDVIVDLRPNSPTFKKWFGTELNDKNRTMMYVPKGFAHGFITLTDEVEAFYLVSEFYAPEQERGLRYDDPNIDIRWPIIPIDISEKDKNWPELDYKYHCLKDLELYL